MSSCPCDSKFYDNGNSICAACSPYCVDCLAYSQCQTCNFTLFRSHNAGNSTCPCIARYYDNNIDVDCKPCHYSCLSCFAGTSSSCWTCAALRTINTTFSCPCNPGLYELGTICDPCSLLCKTCTSNPTTCTSCPINSFLSNFTCFCNTGFFRNGLTCDVCDPQC